MFTMVVYIQHDLYYMKSLSFHEDTQRIEAANNNNSKFLCSKHFLLNTPFCNSKIDLRTSALKMGGSGGKD